MQAIVKSASDLWALSTMTLATASVAGEAHAAPVYFAACLSSALPLELYFFSAPDSRHALDITAKPHAAAAIYPEATSWMSIHGLQLRGAVRQLSPGAEWEAAWQVYLAKFPFTGGMKDVIARNAFYSFRPSWMRLVDNRLGFGHKQEWTSDG